MKTIKKFLLASMLTIFGLANLSMFSLTYAQDVYNEVLNQTTSSTALSTAIN
jgi:hypothetical protein